MNTPIFIDIISAGLFSSTQVIYQQILYNISLRVAYTCKIIFGAAESLWFI